MSRYTLVYGVRLIPEGTLKGVEEARLKLTDGTDTGLTLHTFDGTIPQLRRALDRSLDAFFDLLPGADEEDLQKFSDERPVAQLHLHSNGDASRLAALLLPQIFPIFSVVAPCHAGASPFSVRRWSCAMGR